MVRGDAPVYAHSLLLVQGISSGNMAVERDDGDCDDAVDTADYTGTVLAPGPGPAVDNTAHQAGPEAPQLW